MAKPIAYKPHELDATRARKTGMQNRRMARNIAVMREVKPIAVYSRPGRKITRAKAISTWDTANAEDFRRVNEPPGIPWPGLVRGDPNSRQGIGPDGQHYPYIHRMGPHVLATPTRFRPDVKLDPSQVRDMRGVEPEAAPIAFLKSEIIPRIGRAIDDMANIVLSSETENRLKAELALRRFDQKPADRTVSDAVRLVRRKMGKGRPRKALIKAAHRRPNL